MRIDQLLAGFSAGDAMSSEALGLRALFRRAGRDSDLFVDPACTDPALRAECRPLAAYAGEPGDLCLHHYGIASPAAEVFLRARARKILVYHNITPAEYFIGFDDAIAERLCAARAALPRLAAAADAVWAVSDFNARELRAAGVRDVRVFPLLVPPFAAAPAPDPEVLARFPHRLATVLCVGRLAPNKRIEDLIEAFAWYHRALNPYSRLVIVGSPRSAPRYAAMLRLLIGDLDLPHAGMEGFASPAGLAAYYRVADVYVSASAHEGFGLPALEAMQAGVPVIARDAGGTAETLGGAGVLYDDLAPAELGALIGRVLGDAALRAEILASQAARLDALARRDPGAELEALLAGLMPTPGAPCLPES